MGISSLFIFTIASLLSVKVELSQNVDDKFAPNVEATCKAGFMEIRVNVNFPYHGVVYTMGHRREPCLQRGSGRRSVTLRLPLVTDKTKPDYCGVVVNETTKERYAPVVIRVHEMLELADDKYYNIKCGLQGYRVRNETNFVDISLLDANGEMTSEAVHQRKYRLSAKILGTDRLHVMRLRECFMFGDLNTSLAITDALGCPMDNNISPFAYNDTTGTAEATIYKMYKFQNSNRVNFQCDVFICKAPCEEEVACPSRPERLIDASVNQEGRALPDDDEASKGSRVQAATSVYVMEPGALDIRECEYYPPWLWILCIALAVLFIIMMIINIFLCSAMTCSCTKTEVIEKEPSIIEEYDPYRSWHGSQYGSRYSLNGKGYTSGASTMNSARSVSSHSDHYAIVHSRPDSRYSGHHSLKHDRHYRSPPSTAGSHYSNRI